MLPAALGLISVCVQFSFQHVNVKYGFVKATLASIAVLGVGSGLTATILFTLYELVDASLAPYWFLILTVALALTCYLYSQYLPQTASDTDYYDPTDVSAWEKFLVQEMRVRQEFTEAQIQEHLMQTREHLRDSGRYPDQEYGDPRTYARSLATSPGLKRRRMGWYKIGMMIFSLGLCFTQVLTNQHPLLLYGYAAFACYFAFAAYRDFSQKG